MNPKDVIGCIITDILVWSKIEVGGLDEADVSIEINNNIFIGIPWGFDSNNIEKVPKENSESLFENLNEIPIYFVNPERKSIGEILKAKKIRESSILGRIKLFFGFCEQIPKEYIPYKTEYRENKLKYLKNQKIADFLIFEDSDSKGFLELENGFIITETILAPHGTGLAGLNYFESLNSFEENCGKDYERLTKSKSYLN